MAAEYKSLWDHMRPGELSTTTLRTRDQAFIPDDPANRDFQELAAWLEDGNTPDPPDPLPQPGPPTPDANARLDAGIEAARLASEQADQMAQGARSTRDDDGPVTQGQLAALQQQVNKIEMAVTAMLMAQAGPLPRREA